MKKNSILLLIVCVCVLIACDSFKISISRNGSAPADTSENRLQSGHILLPVPSYTAKKGESIHFASSSSQTPQLAQCEIKFTGDSDSRIDFLQKNLRAALALPAPGTETFVEPFEFNLDSTLNLPDEAYRYEIAQDGHQCVRAKTYRGLLWGAQTLIQKNRGGLLGFPESNTLTPQYNTTVREVYTDIPARAYRGLHLDVCRHFFTVNEIKRILAMMSRYKLNTFHWHLTDDQAWRIQINAYPKLIEVGAKRKSSPCKGNRDAQDNVPYGPYFYTQDEIREVVAFADCLGIEVIPEIEMPGHAVAALAAYPELGCTKGPYEVHTRWGVTDDVFCAGNPETYTFLKTVIDEVCTLFPGRYIHLGGDEAPIVRWKACPACQKMIREKGLRSTQMLQGYFITQMANYIKEKGKIALGWDEILFAGPIPKDTVIMSWRGSDYGRIAEAHGHKTVMSPSNPLYLNFAQSRRGFEPETIGGLNTYIDLMQFNPDRGLKEGAFGVQGNLWSEYFFSDSYLEYALFPKITALANIAWRPGSNQQFSLENQIDQQGILATHYQDFARFGFTFRFVPLELPEKIIFNKDKPLTFPCLLGTYPEHLDTKKSIPWIATDGKCGILVHMTAEPDSALRCEPANDNTPHVTTAPCTRTRPYVSSPAPARYVITAPCTLHYHCSLAGTDIVSPKQTMHVQPDTPVEPPADAAQKAGDTAGLSAEHFIGRFNVCADLEKGEKKALSESGKTAFFNLKLPEMPAEYFGVRYSGLFHAKKSGIYTFAVNSDDGLIFTLTACEPGKAAKPYTAVNHDGLHGPQDRVTDEINLKSGFYPAEIRYIQGEGGAMIRLQVKEPGAAQFRDMKPDDFRLLKANTK